MKGIDIIQKLQMKAAEQISFSNGISVEDLNTQSISNESLDVDI